MNNVKFKTQKKKNHRRATDVGQAPKTLVTQRPLET